MKKILTLIHLAICFGTMAQQPGTLDKTFGKNGIIKDTSLNLYVTGNNGIILPDDKYFLVYQLTNNPSRKAITRFFPNGSIDRSYGDNGSFITNSFSGENVQLLRQTSGKIVWITSTKITRLLLNGGIDVSFGNNGVCNIESANPDEEELPKSATLQPNGKIVTFGDLYMDGISYGLFRRYTANGQPDSSFANNGKLVIDPGDAVSISGASVISLPDGSLIGGIKITGGAGYFNLIKLKPNGNKDLSFGINGSVITETDKSENLQSIAATGSGQIIASGSVPKTRFGGTPDVITRRYSANGVLDKSFGNQGASIVSFDTLSSIGGPVLINNDGKIVICNQVYSNQNGIRFFALLRLQSNGLADSAFSNNGKTVVRIPEAVLTFAALQSTGKIFEAGFVNSSIQHSYPVVMRFNNSSAISSFFSSATQPVITKPSISITLSPNPTKNVLKVSGLSNTMQSNIMVISNTGKTLIQAVAKSSAYNLVVGTLHSGLYNIAITTNGKTQTLPFLKE